MHEATTPAIPDGWATLAWIAVAAGNTRTRYAVMRGGEVIRSVVIANDTPAVGAGLSPLAGAAESHSAVVVASVNDAAAGAATEAVRAAFGPADVLRIGVDLPIPLRHALDDASTLGQDRALNAVAAYERAQQAVVIADVGTAITVDFVDGEGVFQGGAIAPGVSMMLASLAEKTANLPAMAFEPPDPERGVFGRDTAHAMRLGVASAARGLFRELLDRYAEAYGGYPQVIGTGGDIGLLEPTELVDHVVPDLQIMGIAAALRVSLADEDDGDAADAGA